MGVADRIDVVLEADEEGKEKERVIDREAERKGGWRRNKRTLTRGRDDNGGLENERMEGKPR